MLKLRRRDMAVTLWESNDGVQKDLRAASEPAVKKHSGTAEQGLRLTFLQKEKSL